MIETPLLILRRHRSEDFDEWVALVSDRSLFDYIGVPNWTRADLWNRLLRFAGHWSLFGWRLFLLRSRETGDVLGGTGHADFHRGMEHDAPLYGQPAHKHVRPNKERVS